MSSYREVTKDDVGKMVEVRDGEHQEWQLFELEHVMPNHISHRFIVLLHGTRPVDWSFFKEARIRTSPLPEGWLPDDWRVLGDEEICQRRDYVVCGSSPSFEFCTEYLHFVDKGYVGMLAKDVVAGVSGNLCVIRPRWRPATKDDINKNIKSPQGELRLKQVFEPDPKGRNCLLYRENTGWCIDILAELKVENEGWNVTN